MNDNTYLSTLAEQLQGLLDSLVASLPNIAATALIVVLSLFVARGLRRAAFQLLERVSSNKQVNKLFSTVTYVVVVGTGLFIAMGVLGLSKTLTTLLAGVGILGLALGFAFQDIAENFIAGVMMAFHRPVQIGDLMETTDYLGVVEDVSLRTTVIRTPDGKHVLIPNSIVFQNALVNYSRSPEMRVDLACGVAYGDDLDEAERIAVDAVRDISNRDTSRDVELYYDGFGDSSVNFVLRFWIDYRNHSDYLAARSNAIKQIKKAFDGNGITIPFPIRTLDFGVVGGVNLDEVLPNGNGDL